MAKNRRSNTNSTAKAKIKESQIKAEGKSIEKQEKAETVKSGSQGNKFSSPSDFVLPTRVASFGPGDTVSVLLRLKRAKNVFSFIKEPWQN